VDSYEICSISNKKSPSSRDESSVQNSIFTVTPDEFKKTTRKKKREKTAQAKQEKALQKAIKYVRIG
jgi:hypothetical protein